MTLTEVKESQAKLVGMFKCPKCKDRKIFMDKEGYVKTCMEC